MADKLRIYQSPGIQLIIARDPTIADTLCATKNERRHR
jgi:hypothetical protein